eukprot:11752805-Heterocapsa_arctica.AAC.1
MHVLVRQGEVVEVHLAVPASLGGRLPAGTLEPLAFSLFLPGSLPGALFRSHCLLLCLQAGPCLRLACQLCCLLSQPLELGQLLSQGTFADDVLRQSSEG